MYIVDVHLDMQDDVIFQDRFIWDRRKEQVNIQKHKISFETACHIFNDPALYEIYDEENSCDEDRYNSIGFVNGCLMLFVTTTDRDNLTRIISARKAEPHERSEYYENAQRIQND